VSGLVAAFALGAAAPATRAPAPKAYLIRVSSVCRGYARRLERIPVPSSPSAYGEVIASLRRVLPLLRAQEQAMRALPAPAGFRATLGRLYALDRRSIAELESALAAARRRDAGGVAEGLARFAADRQQVHGLALALGVDCGVN
jgi:hypothetical protein